MSYESIIVGNVAIGHTISGGDVVDYVNMNAAVAAPNVGVYRNQTSGFAGMTTNGAGLVVSNTSSSGSAVLAITSTTGPLKIVPAAGGLEGGVLTDQVGDGTATWVTPASLAVFKELGARLAAIDIRMAAIDSRIAALESKAK